MSEAAIRTHLKPLQDFLQRPGVTEISINKPGEIFVEEAGKIERHEIPQGLDYDSLSDLAQLIASSNNQSINTTKPLFSGSLPDGERVQIVAPPCVEPGHVAFSIRKPTVLAFSLKKYEEMGAFENVTVSNDLALSELDRELCELLQQHKLCDFIEKAVQCKKNIVVSGGTSTGKTTFTNAIVKTISHEERLITIEDTRETSLDQPNKLHLLASKGGQGTAKVDVQDLLEACLRLRPDRLFLSELRGAEAFSYLRAVNTGHPGSITTLHADTPKGAYEQLVLMVTQAGLGLQRSEILDYIRSVVEVIIQLKRVNGKRIVSEIYFEPMKHFLAEKK